MSTRNVGSDLLLRVGRDLAFELIGLPDRLAAPIRDFFAYYLRPGEELTAPALRITGTPPSRENLGTVSVIVDEPPLRVGQAGSRLVVEGPGIAGWCDPLQGVGGICLEAPEHPVEGYLVNSVVVALLVQLAVARGWNGLHAAAVVCGGRAIVLPGSSGAGKTTIFCNAHAAGLGVLSDDLVWVYEGDGGFRVVAFPRGSSSGDVPGPSHDDVPVAAIVCPTIVADDDNRLVPLTVAEATRELISQSAIIATGPLAGEHFRALVRLAGSAPCYRLEAGRLRERVPSLLEGLFDDTP